VFDTFRSSCVSEGHTHPTEWEAPVLCRTLVWGEVIVVGSWQGNFWHVRITYMPKESICKLEFNCKLSIRRCQILSILILTASCANKPSCFEVYLRIIQQGNTPFSFIRILILKVFFSVAHRFYKHLFGTHTFKRSVHRGNCFGQSLLFAD